MTAYVTLLSVVAAVALIGWSRALDRSSDAEWKLGREKKATTKANARIREMQEMNDTLADCIVRLADQLERKERDPLGLGFHEPLIRERSWE